MQEFQDVEYDNPTLRHRYCLLFPRDIEEPDVTEFTRVQGLGRLQKQSFSDVFGRREAP